MRIISGFLKGKKIDFIKSTTTRPLRDFVRESAFNVMIHSNLINVPLENANVLDLYSGVGSFGIECISRGVKKTTFVEKDKEALKVLKKNIAYLKIEKKSAIFEVNVFSFFNRVGKNEKYEIIFIDPPFSEAFYIEQLKIIKNSNVCKENHIVIIHREGKSNEDLSGIMDVISIKKYGRSKVIFGNLI